MKLFGCAKFLTQMFDLQMGAFLATAVTTDIGCGLLEADYQDDDGEFHDFDIQDGCAVCMNICYN